MPGESVQRHVCLGTTVVSSPLEAGADQAPLLLDQLQAAFTHTLPEPSSIEHDFQRGGTAPQRIDRLLRHGVRVLKMGNTTQLHLRGACESSDVHKYESHTRANQNQRHGDQRGRSSK